MVRYRKGPAACRKSNEKRDSGEASESRRIGDVDEVKEDIPRQGKSSLILGPK